MTRTITEIKKDLEAACRHRVHAEREVDTARDEVWALTKELNDAEAQYADRFTVLRALHDTRFSEAYYVCEGETRDHTLVLREKRDEGYELTHLKVGEQAEVAIRELAREIQKLKDGG